MDRAELKRELKKVYEDPDYFLVTNEDVTPFVDELLDEIRNEDAQDTKEAG